MSDDVKALASELIRLAPDYYRRGYADGFADGFKAATENAAKQPIMAQIDAQPAGVRCEAGSADAP